MARYTTPIGICGMGDHPITDAPGCRNKGYTSPIMPRTSFATPMMRLCKEHYYAAFAMRYPKEPLPELA